MNIIIISLLSNRDLIYFDHYVIEHHLKKNTQNLNLLFFCLLTLYHFQSHEFYIKENEMQNEKGEISIVCFFN